MLHFRLSYSQQAAQDSLQWLTVKRSLLFSDLETYTPFGPELCRYHFPQRGWSIQIFLDWAISTRVGFCRWSSSEATSLSSWALSAWLRILTITTAAWVVQKRRIHAWATGRTKERTQTRQPASHIHNHVHMTQLRSVFLLMFTYYSWCITPPIIPIIMPAHLAGL